MGQQVKVTWPGGGVAVTIEEKPGEPWGASFPMYATLGSYALRAVADRGGSDAVSGLGLGTPEEPDVKHNTSFGVRFRVRSHQIEPLP